MQAQVAGVGAAAETGVGSRSCRRRIADRRLCTKKMPSNAGKETWDYVPVACAARASAAFSSFSRAARIPCKRSTISKTENSPLASAASLSALWDSRSLILRLDKVLLLLYQLQLLCIRLLLPLQSSHLLVLQLPEGVHKRARGERLSGCKTLPFLLRLVYLRSPGFHLVSCPPSSYELACVAKEAKEAQVACLPRSAGYGASSPRFRSIRLRCEGGEGGAGGSSSRSPGMAHRPRAFDEAVEAKEVKKAPLSRPQSR